MQTIILTGATGFLGSHILKAILSKSNDKILLLKRSFSNIWRIKDEIKDSRVTYLDIDKQDLYKIDWNGIDTIIHCATEYGRSDSLCHKILKTNLIFPIHLIELAIKNNVKTFINTDTYFNKDNIAYNHLLGYSLSKKSLNLWLKHFSKQIQVINLILEHIYGEFDNADKFVEKLIQDIAINQVEKVALTHGEQKRDFVYIKDVVDTYMTAIKYGRNNHFRYREFEVGTGNSIPIKDFCNLIKKISKSNTYIDYGAINYREDELMNSKADTLELNSLLDSTKFISPKEGIERILRIYGK